MKHFFATLLLFICVVYSSSVVNGADLSDFSVSEDLKGILSASEVLPIEDRAKLTIELLNDYSTANPRDPLGHYYTGRYKSMNDEWEKAITSYGEALALSPDFSDAHAESAKALFSWWSIESMGKASDTLDLSRRAIDSALAISPERIDFLTTASVIYNAEGKTKEALAFLEKALTLEPASVSIHTSIATYYSNSKMCTASIRHYRFALILSYGKNRLSTIPRDDLYYIVMPEIGKAETMLNESQNFVKKARETLKNGKIGDTAEALTAALNSCKDNSSALYEFGLFYQKHLNDLPKAREYFTRALLADPLNSDAILALCTLPRDENDENAPSPDSIHTCRNNSILAANIRTESANLWLDQPKPASYFRVASGYAALGETQHARYWIEAAYSTAPDNERYTSARKCARTPACSLADEIFK